MSFSEHTMPDIRPDVSVQIMYLSALRDATGRRQEDVAFAPGATLQEVAAWLNARYALSVPSPRVMAVLNGKGWQQLPKKLGTEIENGDVIALFPPIAGG